MAKLLGVFLQRVVPVSPRIQFLPTMNALRLPYKGKTGDAVKEIIVV
jgi:hypothetical protein